MRHVQSARLERGGGSIRLTFSAEHRLGGARRVITREILGFVRVRRLELPQLRLLGFTLQGLDLATRRVLKVVHNNNNRHNNNRACSRAASSRSSTSANL